MKKKTMIGMYLFIAAVILTGLLGNTATTQAARTALNEKNLTIRIGETQTVKVTNITKKQRSAIVWKTSNKRVATVDKKGKVTGKKAGKATITAKVHSKKYSCKVTVVKKDTAEDDRATLKKIIEQQTAKGATVPKSLSSKSYTWDEDGRLTDIDWEKKDVAGDLDFSSFTRLKTIAIGGNKRVTGCITTGLTSLESIDAWRCDISQLDVSSNTNLTSLNCTGDNLSSLDISKNKKLQGIECSYNSLSSLDVSQHRDLKNIGCSDNPIKTLDVSAHPQLESLYCENCQLTSLDVSSSPLLVQLYCPKNQLTSLDISKNPLLMSLYCQENAITSLDVSQNIKLQYLDCTQNSITALDVSSLAQGGEGTNQCVVICDLAVVVTGSYRPPVTVTTDANNNIIVTGTTLIVGQH